MTIRTTCLLTFLLAAPLAGCNAPEPKLPHIAYETASRTIAFPADSVKLDAKQKHTLDRLLADIPPQSISYASLAADEHNHTAVRRAQGIRHYLVSNGVSASAVYLEPAGGDIRTVLLSVHYARAVPPAPCPDWSKNSVANYNNTGASDFGCAYYNNLTMQLADPADYDAGHGDSRYDAVRSGAAVAGYMTGGAASSSAATSSAGAPAAATP